MRPSIILALLASFSLLSRAVDWPEGYQLADDTTSPDGHYGIIAPVLAANPTDEDTNFLVDLKARKVLGKIINSSHEIGRNRSGVHADWSDDSKLCVVQFDSRYGFYSTIVLAPKDDTFQQFNVGVKIKEVLAAAMYKMKSEGTAPGLDSRYAPGGKILFRAWADNDPKRTSNSAIAGLFWGTFDTTTGKWLSTTAKKVDIETVDSAYNAYRDVDPDYAGYSAENKAEAIEHELNDTYRVLKAVLPADQFAALKKDQLAWLKKRETPKTDDEFRKMTEDRVKMLKAKLWE